MNLSIWRQSLPKAERVAQQVGVEVTKELSKVIEEKAQQWISENKLIHAGAAMKLAKELKDRLEK